MSHKNLKELLLLSEQVPVVIIFIAVVTNFQENSSSILTEKLVWMTWRWLSVTGTAPPLHIATKRWQNILLLLSLSPSWSHPLVFALNTSPVWLQRWTVLIFCSRWKDLISGKPVFKKYKSVISSLSHHEICTCGIREEVGLPVSAATHY